MEKEENLMEGFNYEQNLPSVNSWHLLSTPIRYEIKIIRDKFL